MTHTYQISGMTCSGCKAKVQGLLSQVIGVKSVSIDLEKASADIEMDKHIPTETLRLALKDYPKYQLTESISISSPINIDEPEAKSWFVTYKPILLIFGYITTLAILISSTSGTFNVMLSMRVFMGAFFLTFSFFKMLDLKGFAESYAMYDVIAKRIPQWGYAYAVIEFLLGLAFVVNFQPFITNIITLTVMSVSIIGVLQSVLNNKKIKCACLGAIFNLPMSTVTIIEDGLMIGMSATMLFLMI
jgi:copper chaperone CopZ